ncbi:hypothetical protein HUT16_04075 [Kitasatospora sp. NA04385]|uniref:hypothetical protein n=1 Tax=Kitasatospora sp. NA04385 TaxID=2742135 RepID=UPI0015918898|nr:hypothetical protein [Kitasatospora sp. NA04385]QKW18351.1 hypothetical protein HUT16_04075 [Kitasatospora sp. NA04385]
MSIARSFGKTNAEPGSVHRIPGTGIFSGPGAHTGSEVFSDAGLRQLDEVVRSARLAAGAAVPTLLAPVPAGGDAARLTAQHCTFDHCGLLLFPRTLESGLRRLEELGLSPMPVVPSTVVRRRLAERYGLDPADCEVHITRLRLGLPTGRRHTAVEIFLLPRDGRAYSPRLEEAEVAAGYEQHTAFVVARPSTALLTRLVASWRTEAGLLTEGGGHNPHEGGPDGSTVMYFVREHAHPGPRRRFELHCPGDLTPFIDRLPREGAAVRRAYAAWRPIDPAPLSTAG